MRHTQITAKPTRVTPLSLDLLDELAWRQKARDLQERRWQQIYNMSKRREHSGAADSLRSAIGIAKG